jgi:hypothetical protein
VVSDHVNDCRCGGIDSGQERPTAECSRFARLKKNIRNRVVLQGLQNLRPMSARQANARILPRPFPIRIARLLAASGIAPDFAQHYSDFAGSAGCLQGCRMSFYLGKLTKTYLIKIPRAPEETPFMANPIRPIWGYGGSKTLRAIDGSGSAISLDQLRTFRYTWWLSGGFYPAWDGP